MKTAHDKSKDNSTKTRQHTDLSSSHQQ